MNKILYIILGVVAMIALWFYLSYNRMVEREEAVHKAWSQVENVYQRRSDLIPNIVSVVKSYSDYEQNTLTRLTEERSIALSTQIEDNTDAEALERYDNAQRNIGQSLNQLLISIENYPDLKASEQFMTLSTELAGCENRIKVERRNYNEAAMDFNRSIRYFPNSLIANSLGFKKVAYFNSNEEASKAPSVK